MWRIWNSNSYEASASGMSYERLQKIAPTLNEQYLKTGKFPGFISAVARKGKVVHYETLGFADIETGESLKRDSLFRIYSMSKAITSIAIMQLLEKSKFRLDDPVYWYIPSWKSLRVYESGIYPNFLTSKPKRHMTIRDLL